MANSVTLFVETAVEQFIYDRVLISRYWLINKHRLYAAFLIWWKQNIGERIPTERFFDRVISEKIKVLYEESTLKDDRKIENE